MESKIVIFSTCKPMSGIYGITQRNAVSSWNHLGFDVVLVGSESIDLCDELGVTYGGEVDRCDGGYPLMNSVFETAQGVIDSDLVMYVNADILLTDLFMKHVVPKASPDRFITGYRFESTVDWLIDFDSDWVSAIDPQFEKPHARDYFVFKNGLFEDIPPFSMGHYSWDTWLQSRAKQLVTVVNVTQMCCVHQVHEKYQKSDISERNKRLKDEYSIHR